MIDRETLDEYRRDVDTGVMLSETSNVVRQLLDEIDRLREERDKYREAAEIFRDFGEFDARSHYEKQQLRRAKWTMTGRQVNESDSPQTGG